MVQEDKSKITNPERIARIIHRVCSVKMSALVRTTDTSTVGIRAKFNSIKKISGKTYINLDSISEQGTKMLTPGLAIQIEILGMATKVLFNSTVNYSPVGEVILAIPTSLITIERRQNARYNTTPALMAYLKLSLWSAKDSDIAAPPTFDHLHDLSSWCAIADMSLGGICVLTRFPSVLRIVESGVIDNHAELILPMQIPLKVPVQFRWQKRIREHREDDATNRYQLSFRYGIEFVNPQENVRIIIRQFLKQLSMAEAI